MKMPLNFRISVARQFQGEMGSRRMVVGEIGSDEAFQVAVVEFDDVIEALTADGADQPPATHHLDPRFEGEVY